MKQIIVVVLAASMGLTTVAQAQLSLTGITMYGSSDSNGGWNGTYDYWDTVGGNFAFNIYLFTGPTNAPIFLNSGDTSASLNPNLALTPGTYAFQFACAVRPTDPSAPDLGMNLYFNNDSVNNRISAVVPNYGSCNFSVVSQGVLTYGEGGSTPGAGSLIYTYGNLVVTLGAFCSSSATPALVDGYTNAPGSYPDFTGTFTLTVAATGTNSSPPLSISKAVELAWPSLTNSLYQVQWSTNLAGANWFDLGGPLQGNGATNYLFDSATDPNRFYRVVMVP